MDNQILASVNAAISCVHAPDTTPTVRAQAGNFLEQFKQRPDCAQLSLGLFFATAPTPDTTPLRHFTLHAIETSFKKHWYTWDPTMQENVKQAVVEIATNKLGDILVEPLAVREKVVTLLVELAKREWPQRWPTFLETVLTLCRAGYTQADIGVRVLCRLMEDGTNPDFNTELPVKRRHEILSALHSTCDQFLNQLLQLLTSQYTTFVQSQRQNQRALMLVNSTLNTLEHVCEWIPLAKIFNPAEPTVDMRQMFVTLMQDPCTPTRISATNCLKCCVSRHKVFTSPIVNHVRPMISIVNEACRRLDLSSSLPSVLRNDVLLQKGGLGGSTNSGEHGQLGKEVDEDLYAFHKAVAGLVSATGINLIAKLDHPQNGPELNQYLEIAMVLFAHPSLSIGAIMVSAFSQLLVRNQAVLDSSKVGQMYPRLFNILLTKLRKWGSPNEHDTSGQLSLYSTIDYDDHEAFQVEAGKMRGRVTVLARSISRASPMDAVQHLGTAVQHLLGGPHAVAHDQLRAPLSCATMFSTSYVLFESLATMTEIIVSNIGKMSKKGLGDDERPRDVQTTEALMQPLHDIAHMWFNYKTLDPLLLAQQLTALTAFAQGGNGGYFRRDSALLGAVLEKLFECLTFVPPLEADIIQRNNNTTSPTLSTNNNSSPQQTAFTSATGPMFLQQLHSDTKSARRRAASSLIRLGQLIPDLMFSNLPGLCGRVNALLQQNMLLPSEQSLLFEMLVLVSNSFGDLQKQSTFLDDVLATAVGFLTSNGTSKALSDPKMYVQAIQGTDREGRWRVQTVLTTLTCVAKRSCPLKNQSNGLLQHPFAHLWPILLPNILSSLRTVHALWQPDLRAAVEQMKDVRWMLRITPLELMSIMGYEDHFETNSDGTSSKASASVLNNINAASESDVELATQSAHVRTRCYDLLGLAATHSASVQGNNVGDIRYRENPKTWKPNTSGGLFDTPNIVPMLQQSVCSNLDSMEHRHFRALLTAFLQPYCLSSPLPLFSTHVAPILSSILIHGTKRVNEAWAGWNNADTTGVPGTNRIVNPCHMPLGVPGASMEMIQIKIIRDLSREMASTLSELIPPKPARRNAQGKIIKQQRGGGKQGGGKHHSGGGGGGSGGIGGIGANGYVSPFAQLMFHDVSKNGMAEIVLRTLAMAASWPDSNTLGIILKVIERILPVVATNTTYFPFVGGTLLTSLLHTLFSESPYSKENQHGLIHVISLVYSSVSLGITPVEQGGGGVVHSGQQHSGVALRVFATLPGATEQIVTTLNHALVNQKSTKQRRLLVQDFLQGCAASAKQGGGGGGDGGDSILSVKLFAIQNSSEPVRDYIKQSKANQKLFEEANGEVEASKSLSVLFK